MAVPHAAVTVTEQENAVWHCESPAQSAPPHFNEGSCH